MCFFIYGSIFADLGYALDRPSEFTRGGEVYSAQRLFVSYELGQQQVFSASLKVVDSPCLGQTRALKTTAKGLLCNYFEPIPTHIFQAIIEHPEVIFTNYWIYS